MTEKANPSTNRTIDSFKTAGAIAYGAHGGDGWISGPSNPTEVSIQDPDINEGNLNAFAQTSSGSSFDVDIDPGEAFVFGSWLAIDTTTTVTLASSTNNQTVYVGWNKDGTDDVIIGLDSAFDSASGDTDEKIPLFDFDTDGSGVTNVVNRRTIDHTIDARYLNQTNSVSSNYTTDGEQLLFVDSSGSAVTITLSTTDADSGSNVIIVDSGGSASTNNITVDTQGSGTINGGSSESIQSDYGALALGSNGTDWYTTGSGGGGISVEDTGVVTIDPASVIDFDSNLNVTNPNPGEARVSVADNWVDETGDSMSGALNMQTNDVDNIRRSQSNVGDVTSNHLEATQSLTVPTDYSMVVADKFEVDGTLTVNGSLKVV